MPKYTAKTADKYAIYIKAVQYVPAEIQFVEETFNESHSRPLRSLREDFCGGFAAAAEFIKRHAQNTALVLDLDSEVLNWGRKNILPQLGARKKNLQILQQNVISVTKPQVDAILAMNFSYFIFKQRAQMLAYFRAVYQSLKKDGMFFMDAYGGIEAQKVMREKRKTKDFTYVWEQAKFNPINSEIVNYIHFYFPDRTRIEKAFTYDWRLWTLREIRELLAEAGFRDSGVFWEGWDAKKCEGDGIFLRAEQEENCEAWIVYLAAWK